MQQPIVRHFRAKKCSVQVDFLPGMIEPLIRGLSALERSDQITTDEVLDITKQLEAEFPGELWRVALRQQWSREAAADACGV